MLSQRPRSPDSHIAKEQPGIFCLGTEENQIILGSTRLRQRLISFKNREGDRQNSCPDLLAVALWPNPRNPALAGKTKTSALLSKGDLGQSDSTSHSWSQNGSKMCQRELALQGISSLWKEVKDLKVFFCFSFYVVFY